MAADRLVASKTTSTAYDSGSRRRPSGFVTGTIPSNGYRGLGTVDAHFRCCCLSDTGGSKPAETIGRFDAGVGERCSFLVVSAENQRSTCFIQDR